MAVTRRGAMDVRWRRLQPGELDHELIWLLVTVSAAVVATAWLMLRLPWPACTFRALTGLPCFTCGATRSALAFLHGDFLAAWLLNPLAALTLGGVALFDLYALLVVSTGRERLRPAIPKGVTRRLFIAAGLMALANWMYLLHSR